MFFLVPALAVFMAGLLLIGHLIPGGAASSPPGRGVYFLII